MHRAQFIDSFLASQQEGWIINKNIPSPAPVHCHLAATPFVTPLLSLQAGLCSVLWKPQCRSYLVGMLSRGLLISFLFGFLSSFAVIPGNSSPSLYQLVLAGHRDSSFTCSSDLGLFCFSFTFLDTCSPCMSHIPSRQGPLGFCCYL